jgi:hypothetical protein
MEQQSGFVFTIPTHKKDKIMAINISRFRIAKDKQRAAEALAEKLAEEQEEESSWQSILSIAAPIAASVLLPGIGTAAMGLLGGGALGGLGTAAAGAISGGTLTGGLLAGLGKAAGTYAISEGIDTIGREGFGAGADVEDIDMSGYAFGSKGEEQGRKDLESMISASDKGQISSALLSGVMGGIDTMGGIDAIKAKGSEFGKKLSGKWGKAYEGTTEGLGMEKAVTKDIIPKADSPMQLPDLKYESPLATEGGSPLNFLTGEVVGEEGQTWAGAQANLLDNLPSYQGTSILDSFTQYPQEVIDYFDAHPDMSLEERKEIIVSLFGGQ